MFCFFVKDFNEFVVISDRNSINSSGDESDRERRLNRAKHNNYDSDNERNQIKKKKKVVADDDE